MSSVLFYFFAPPVGQAGEIGVEAGGAPTRLPTTGARGPARPGAEAQGGEGGRGRALKALRRRWRVGWDLLFCARFVCLVLTLFTERTCTSNLFPLLHLGGKSGARVE